MNQYLSILLLFKAVWGLLMVSSLIALIVIGVLLCLVKGLDEEFKKNNLR